eukprot:1472776-Prymnesium_polylepis.1
MQIDSVHEKLADTPHVPCLLPGHAPPHNVRPRVPGDTAWGAQRLADEHMCQSEEILLRQGAHVGRCGRRVAEP